MIYSFEEYTRNIKKLNKSDRTKLKNAYDRYKKATEDYYAKGNAKSKELDETLEKFSKLLDMYDKENTVEDVETKKPKRQRKK